MQRWLYTAPVLIAILLCKPQDVFSKTCNFVVNGSSGESITSEFESSEDCETSIWVITAPLNHNVRLQFATFQLSDFILRWHEWFEYWIHPYMQIYDGRNTTDTSLGVFTGARRPFTIQSSGRFMLVKLRFAKLWWRRYLSNLKGVYTFNTTKDKPKILITHPVVRAAPRHFVWCSAEGYPPINISIFKNSTLLANGTGLVMTRLNQTGNYSCVASNEAGNDTKDLPVTIVDCRNLCVSDGKKANGQVENQVQCRTSNSSVDIFKCLPTTTTDL